MRQILKHPQDYDLNLLSEDLRTEIIKRQIRSEFPQIYWENEFYRYYGDYTYRKDNYYFILPSGIITINHVDEDLGNEEAWADSEILPLGSLNLQNLNPIDEKDLPDSVRVEFERFRQEHPSLVPPFFRKMLDLVSFYTDDNYYYMVYYSSPTRKLEIKRVPHNGGTVRILSPEDLYFRHLHTISEQDIPLLIRKLFYQPPTRQHPF